MQDGRVKEIILYFMSRHGGEQEKACISRLEKAGLTVRSCKEELEFLKLLFLKESTDGLVVFTDYGRAASAFSAKGGAAAGLLTEENRGESFGEVHFLAETPEVFDRAYAELVYARKRGLPCVILETERCIVRESTEQDVEAFYNIYAHPAVTRYMEKLFENPEEERAYIRAYRERMYGFYGFGIWTVLLKETWEVIGRAGLDLREGSEIPELGFVIGVPWQGRGLAAEVCRAILRYAGEELALSHVQAFARPGNRESVRLLKKLGFVQRSSISQDGTAYLCFERTTENEP